MGASRAWAPHRRWTDYEESVLREQYATARLDELEALLPGRGRRMIQCKAHGMGLVRQRDPKRTTDQVLVAKREHMAKKRAESPDVAREKQRRWVEQNRDRLNAKRREWHGATVLIEGPPDLFDAPADKPSELAELVNGGAA